MGKRMWYVSARVVRNWHQSYQQKGKGLVLLPYLVHAYSLQL